MLARLRPAERAEGMADAVRRGVLITDSRSPEQDVLFAEQQLVEMAVRALSPGTNDPYTAINAIEEVAVGIVVAVSARGSRADGVQQDSTRVYFRPVGLREIVDMPFDQIRPCALGQVPVLQALIDLAFRIETAAEQPETATQVREHVRVLLEQFRDADPHPRDLHRVERHVIARRTETKR